MKLRVGYGVTGQQEITDYLYITNYSLGNNTTSQYMGSVSYTHLDVYKRQIQKENSYQKK